MVSRLYPDGAYGRYYCQNRIKDLKNMKINCLHPEAQLLCYNCHLRYIFNYAL